MSRIEVKNMAEQESQENPETPDHLRDIERLTKTALKKKYSREYNSWRNGKSRAKETNDWDPAFEDFSDFLRIMGPSKPGETLDRIDWNDLHYGPGRCRWASKKLQANNRSTTTYVHQEGVERPLSEVSEEIEEKPDTIRKRIRRSGDEELAFGWAEKPKFGTDPRKYRPWPKPHDFAVQREWEDLYHQAGGPEKFSRYEFLISTLKSEISRIRYALREYEAAHPDEWPEKLKEAYDLLPRLRETLAVAEADKLEWQRVLTGFKSRMDERTGNVSRPWYDRTDDER